MSGIIKSLEYFPITYFSIMLLFIFPILVAEIIYSRAFKLKKGKLARFISAILVLCFGSAVIIAVQFLFPAPLNLAVEFCIYLSLFLLTLICIKICCSESWMTILFTGIAGYATQNLVAKFFDLVAHGVGLYSNLRTNIYIYTLVKLIFFAIYYVGLYFLFGQRISKHAAKDSKLNVLLISAIALIVTIVLSSIFVRYAAESFILNMAGCAFSCICCVLILIFESGLLEKDKYKHEAETLQILLNSAEKQFIFSKENIDLINIKCHDLKHQIRTLSNTKGEALKEALEEIENVIEIYDLSAKTGNDILDTVITEKSLFCKNHGITMTCMADGKKLSFISPADSYALFGNIISNAIEAVAGVEDADKRVISFTTKQKDKLLSVHIYNYFQGEIKFLDGLPMTKADTLRHGFGMQSIRALVKKYGGELLIYTKEDEFHLEMLFTLNY